MRRILTFFLAWILAGAAAHAQGLSLIRDEEIERGLTFYLTPLFREAGLNPHNMAVHLVRDDSINAFAAQGLHVFVHTGLLLKAENAQEVIAVLAHETGHIAGGHIVRLYENMRIAQRNMLLSMIMGTVAAIASGRGDVGAAVAMGGISSTQGLLAGYRRTEENAADQVAVDLLRKTGHDFSGFEGIMRKLRHQESYQMSEDAVLWRTHPMVRERLAFILEKQKAELEKTLHPNRARMKKENEMFVRMQAKLFAFIYTPERTFERYPETDKSVAARYARSIAFYRRGDFPEALKRIDALISDYPEDPYFYELKGQILFETGRAAEAVPVYEKAVERLPDSVLLRLGTAQAQIEADTPGTLKTAIANLELVSKKEGAEMPLIWHFLAVAYGRSGNIGMASYALAEYNFLNGREDQAENFARRAAGEVPYGSPTWMRSQDILENLKNRKNGKNERLK